MSIEAMKKARAAMASFQNGTNGLYAGEFEDEIKDLDQAIEQAQRNKFNPDWNQLEACQNSLREHMAEIQKLRGEMGVLVGVLGAALQVIQTVDGDDAAECQMLMELQNKIIYAIRGASI